MYKNKTVWLNRLINFRFVFLSLFPCFLLILLSSCMQLASKHTDQSARLKISKSLQDHREYYYYTLPNQMQVVLISDPQTTMAATALNVNAGSANNPKDRQGLAHFLEHMLFLGTAKYPESGEYKTYITSHGGSINAYTDITNTNYFFAIDSNFLEPALDRFSQFFIAPLFNGSSLEKERNIVHSEFIGGLQQDSRRLFQVVKEVLNPAHPQSQFNVGNLQTLADRPGKDIRQEVIDFFNENYSANLMQLVVIGKEPIGKLKEMINSKFTAVPNKNLKKLKITQPLVQPDQLPLDIEVTSLKQLEQLHLLFPIPEQISNYKVNPVLYITHLLGYEGKGSLLSYLRQQNWADELHAGMMLQDSSSAMLEISIKLTEEGKKHKDTITGLVFSTVKRIARDGNSSHYQALAAIQTNSFNYAELTPPQELVIDLADRLADFPPNDVLTANSLLEHYDGKEIADLLGYIRPDNMIRVYLHPKLAPHYQLAEWYKTPYQLKKLGITQIESWAKQQPIEPITLPGKNPFISTNNQLISNSSNELTLLNPGSSQGLAWYKPDTQFGLPKGDFYLAVLAPAFRNNITDRLALKLWIELVKDQLTEQSYDASLAGINHKLYLHSRGFSLKISGFTEKQSLLLNQLMQSWKTVNVSPERFAEIKQNLQKELRNQTQQNPSDILLTKLNETVLLPEWSIQEQLNALSKINFTDCQKRIAEISQQIQTLSFAYGNYNLDQAQKLNHIVSQYFKSSLTGISFPEVKNLKNQAYWLEVQHDHPDNGVLIYLQGKEKSFREKAKFTLLAELLNAPFYDYLRTKKHLGYSVFSFPYNLFELPGIAFITQVTNHSPEATLNITADFFRRFNQYIDQLDETALNKIKASIITRIQAKQNHFSQLSEYYWYQLNLGNDKPDLNQQLIEAIKNTDLHTLRTAYQTQLGDFCSQCLILLSGKEKITPSNIKLPNIKAFSGAL